MRHVKHHSMHCAPMLLITVIAIASGAGVASLLPVLACVLMMSIMMGGHGGHSHGGPSDR